MISTDTIAKMPSNSIVKDSIVVGGLTLLGYMAGGKLGSMFGAVIGTVVCSLFNTETPMGAPPEDTRRYTPYSRVPTRRRKANKSKGELREQSKCTICLEPFKPSIVLLPCSHMCFCDDCFDKVIRRNINTCPICREKIEEFMPVYPS